MPSFHTKTIESILDPVSQQVSRLVILHEEAEDGNAMPDLERPVQGVSKAVQNLVNVGRETINSSDDHILKQDMPNALKRVEQASRLLEDASSMLKNDPFSQPARRKLIEGSRGILQGTSLLLNCFDESEVRKIIKECRKVLEFVSVVEVIDSMEDLVKFVQNLSPCLSKVSREVDYRVKELTHQVHREMLSNSLESLKTAAPMLICSMKMCVQLSESQSRTKDAIENRGYLANRMNEELNEIIRVLQLTTYEEDSWESDDMSKLKKAQQIIASKLQSAHDWLEDPTAVTGGVGERSVRNILEIAKKIADLVNPEDRDQIRKMANDIEAMVNALCELRNDGRGDSAQAHSLGRAINNKLQDLNATILRAIQNKDQRGGSGPGTAPTVFGKFDQAQKWLTNPGFDDGGVGAAAVDAITRDCRRIAQSCPSAAREDINNLCNEIEHLSKQLSDLVRRGMGNTPQAQEIARRLQAKLQQLKKLVDRALITRVVDDFIDIYTPLKQFTDAVNSPKETPNREGLFQDKAQALVQFTSKCAATARNVASSLASNKRLAEGIFSTASEVESMAPQLISAGRIRFQHPESGSAGEHYENLRSQTQDNLEKLRSMVDEAVDSVGFVQASEEAIHRYTALCENAIAQRAPVPMVENTSNIARLANRVLGVAKQEAENSEDATFISKINQSADSLQRSIPAMVQDAKQVAININDSAPASRWRDSNKTLIRSVSDVKEALTPPAPDLSRLSLNDDYSYVEPKPRQPAAAAQQQRPKPKMDDYTDFVTSLDGFIPEPRQAPVAASAPPQHNHYTVVQPRADTYAPPRPPPPSSNDIAPPRPPPPAETDDEYEMPFPTLQPNQPIMMAAHELHQEVRQWSSKENEIIAAAKKMAIHMARLSALCGGQGSKKDLIACAKLIAETSEEVTRLAKEQAKLCTDKRMRTNILQVCERIPTIGTQLRILSTVKATLLGAQGSQEDQEATEMLVGNAQNLMQSARETVRACEAASIKIRTDSGCKVSWVRKSPWYQ